MTTYKQAVAEARTLLKRSEDDQWRLAELTSEQLRSGRSERQWAKDIGLANSYVHYLGKIWDRWGALPPEQRPKFSKAIDIVNGRAEQTEEFGTPHQARARVAIRNLPPERKAEVARELLAEPEVAEAVVEEPQAKRAVQQALDRQYESAPRPFAGRVETKAPGGESLALISAFRGIHIAVDRAARLVEKFGSDPDEVVAVETIVADQCLSTEGVPEPPAITAMEEMVRS